MFTLGRPIKDVAADRGLDLDAIDQEARIGGYHVMMGKHYTNYAIAAACTRLLNTVLSDAHTELPVSNYRAEYGCYLSYPVIVGRDGILDTTHLNLTEEEEEKLAQSANFIKERFDAVMAGDMEAASASSN